MDVARDDAILTQLANSVGNIQSKSEGTLFEEVSCQ
jgi:hypothetical protein